MHDIHLVKAIADLAIFIEFSDDAVLDEDSGVEALEQLTTELALMETAAKEALANQLEALAPSYEDPLLRAFVASLPDALGLDED